MKPDKLTIHDLFHRERRYTVPLYQRPYVWGLKAQWEPLWEDIERQADACLASRTGEPRRSHFLGAVVLNVQRIVGRSVARSDVIDGQQRLTTLQLFLAALRDVAKARGSRHAARVERLTSNEDDRPGSSNGFKVWPTNADRALFAAVMTAGSTAGAMAVAGAAKLDDLPRLAGCYVYYAQKIEEYVGRATDDPDAQEERLFSLIQALRTGLQLVVIELEDDDDPQVIFETLNHRGQPLLPSDLIRNAVFQQAAADPEHADEPTYADDLYARYWQTFDTDRIAKPIEGEDRYWHVPERQGRLYRPRIDLFIFHYLTMKTRQELAIGHIFQEFRAWREGADDALEDFLGDLKHYAAIFRRLISPDGADRASMLARRLRSLDTSTVFPFLLYVLGLPDSVLTRVDRDRVIEDVESWLIRRFVCQLTNKNYNKFFLTLLNRVVQAAATDAAPEGVSRAIADAVRAELLRSSDDTVRWPDDTEFRKGWLEKPIYVKSRPDRAVMILTALDARLLTSKTEAVALPSELTVEHLLPQKGSLTDYPLPEVGDAGEAPSVTRSRLIHTVGNLTLLTQALNTAISNGPFREKRGPIALNSALRLNARFQDQAKDSWVEDDIRERGGALFRQAVSIWEHPSTATAG